MTALGAKWPEAPRRIAWRQPLSAPLGASFRRAASWPARAVQSRAAPRFWQAAPHSGLLLLGRQSRTVHHADSAGCRHSKLPLPSLCRCCSVSVARLESVFKLAPASRAERHTRSPAHRPCASCRQMRTADVPISPVQGIGVRCIPQLVAPIDARVGGLHPRDERSRHLDSGGSRPMGAPRPGQRFCATSCGICIDIEEELADLHRNNQVNAVAVHLASRELRKLRSKT